MTINQVGGTPGGSIRPVGPLQDVKAAAEGPAAVPAAPAKPADGVDLSRPGWPPAAKDDDFPPYEALFGKQSYVKDASKIADLLAAGGAKDVVSLQKKLAAQGLDLGPAGVDGKFGPKTYAALVKFLEGDGRSETPESGASPAAAPPVGAAPVTAAPTVAATPVAAAPPQAEPLFPPKAAANGPLASLPPRQPNALSGREFLAKTAGMTPAQREEAIMQEILAGNVPEALRQPRTIEVRTKLKDGREVVGQVQVLPDYLAIGSDADQVRIPMNPLTAQKIADRLGMSLPTRKLVDDVYRQADTTLTPSPLPPTAQMTSNAWYQKHADAVDGQLNGRGGLVAGHKKDVVISNQVTAHPDRVAIYGWHQTNGKPIQGLSTVHESTYADYSHGIRLVGGTMLVDGKPMAVADVLRDPELSKLLSDEGPIKDPRYKV